MADEIPAWARDDFDPESREAIERLRTAEARDPYEERSFEQIDYPQTAPDPYEERPKPAPAPARNAVVDRALRLTSDEFQSNSRPVVENGQINWGDQELGGSAADFFRADAARMAMEKAASEPQRAQFERPSGSAGSGRGATYASVAGTDSDTPVLRAIRGAESSNNPRAQNPRSSAGGLYQFTDGTWGNVLRRMNPQAYGGYNNQQLKELKFNPNLQQAAAQFHLNNDIMPVLQKAGIPATPANIYLSWFQGPQGAVRAYRAPSDAKVSEVFPETVAANAGTRFRGKPYAQWTMDDLREFTATAMSRRMRADGGQVGGGSVDDQPSSDGYASENDLLQPIGKSKMVGEEKPLFDEGVYKAGLSGFSSNNKKSIRYLHHDENDNPIGALQIMTDGPRSKKATIQNVYVAENFRRNKIASGLLKRARQDFDVRHSTDLTNAGRAFARAVKAEGGSVDDQPQRDLSPLGLYSHAAEMAAQLPQDRGPPQQMLATLQNKYGVKPVELQSAQEAFADKPQVTKDELVQHFKTNMPQLEEKVLDGFEGARNRWIQNHAEKLAMWAKQTKSPEEFSSLPLDKRRWHQSTAAEVFDEKMEQERGFPEEMRSQVKGEPKFDDQVLDGGQNYREVLLKLKTDRDRLAEERDAAYKLKNDLVAKYDKAEMGSDEQREIYRQLREAQDKYIDAHEKAEYVRNNKKFKSSHWDEPDVVAHLRMSDRSDDGKKLLHIEEIQSDWGQAGREEGFRDEKDKKLADLIAQRDAATDILQKRDIQRQINDLGANEPGVYSGPYVTNTDDWTDLALKRALKEAADGGYDRMIITAGRDQADRYGLAQQVDRIAYDPEEKVLSFVPKGGGGWTDYNKEATPENLPSIIGKEVTERLLSSEPSRLSGIHNLEAKDLEVGGKGMMGYYDNIVLKRLMKLAKRLDPEAKLGQHKLAESENPLHAIDITPKMREAIKRGLPAFASGGAVDDEEDEGITAYHGSPYDFSKFDISKIGSGEGNATYGHGLYFAGNEDVAKEYREQLKNKSLIDENAPLSNARRAAGELFDSWQGDINGALDDAKYYGNSNDVIKELKKIQANPPKGHMYEVRIKAHPDHFLDWDEVLEDQNDYIKNALHRVAERDEEEKGYSDLHDHLQDPDAYTGGAFYRTMAERGREKEASEILSQMGIKGIRYKDAASRFKNGEPSYNYVVFNHDHVDIKRKYAQGGAVDAG